jgi:polysaccharide pyruvyl transferase WcaK-like protein
MSDVSPACVLWGGYGGGNVGDELTLAVALKDAVARHGERNVAVLTRSVPYSRHVFPGIRMVEYDAVPSVPRWYEQVGILGRRLAGLPSGYQRYVPGKQRDGAGGEREWISVLRGAKEFRLVGGGYLSDYFDVEFLLLPVYWAKRSGLRISTAPLGLGPFRRPESEALIASELADAALEVRDRDSLATAARLGLRAELRPDDGFRCREVVDGLALTRGNKLRLGINVTRQTGGRRDFEDWWVEVVRCLAAWPEVEPSGFCFHVNSFLDQLATARVFRGAGLSEALVAPPALDFRESARALGAFDAVLTSRFHAAVVANVLGLAGVAVASGEYYEAKMEAAVEGARRMAVVDPGRTAPAEAAAMLRSLCQRSAGAAG